MKIKTSLRIIALFTVAILVSFIPENFPDFFGDWSCGKIISEYGTHSYFPAPHNVPDLHWGYRHYLFFIMGMVLFCVQVVDIIDNREK